MIIKTYYAADIRELAESEHWDGETALLKQNADGQFIFTKSYGGWYSDNLGFYPTAVAAEKALAKWAAGN